MARGDSGAVELERLLALIDAAYRRCDREISELRGQLGDLSERLRQAEQDREQAVATRDEHAERFHIALDYMSQGLCVFDAEQKLLLSNRRYAELYGLAPEQIRPGMVLRDIVALRAAIGNDPVMSFDDYISQVPSSDSFNSPSGTLVELSNGRSIAIRHQTLADGGYVATHEDVTERRAAEARIAHLAHHDALTGLPNRVLFRDRLQQALASAERGQSCAVLYVDLDDFKVINDTLGHELGDTLLGAVAERLRRSVRQADTVARLGGDEFAIVQTDIRESSNAGGFAQRLVAELGAAYEVGGHRVLTGTSIGIALAPADGTDPDQLMRNADLALYSAKVHGKGRFACYRPEMASLLERRRKLEQELRLALDTARLELLYRPLVDAANAELRGFEAELCWDRPGFGLVSGPDFLALAEAGGVSVSIAEWALARACAEAAGWPGGIRLALDISAEQLGSAALVGTVAAVLGQSGLAPERLELDIAEAAILRDPDTARARMLGLKRLGVRLALDHFGSGCCSLRRLRELPFDRVKLDAALLRELDQPGGSLAMARALGVMCASLGIGLSADGVATEQQLLLVRAERCDEAQGDLFGPSYPASALGELLAARGERRPNAACAMAATPG